MKKIVIMLLFTFLSLFAKGSDVATKDDIKMLIHTMDKRFEQVDKRFEQVDKRFEQIDKRLELMQREMNRRFEQVDKRLDFMQNILYALMGLIFASPFVAIYLKDKKEEELNKKYELLKDVVFALKELAQNDEKVAKALKVAGLL
jgi:prefoldin subunit 5